MYTAGLRSLTLILLFCASTLLTIAPVVAQSDPQPEAGKFMTYLPLLLSPAALDPVEQEVVDLTNQFRAENNCPPLAVSPELMAAARSHSQSMALGDYFSHFDPDGHGPDWRAQQAAYRGIAGWENIAAGRQTAAAVVEAWKNSAAHRDNMLDCSLTDIGIGHFYLADDSGAINYQDYWTQAFGRS